MFKSQENGLQTSWLNEYYATGQSFSLNQYILTFTIINNASVGLAISPMGYIKNLLCKQWFGGGKSRTFLLGQYQARVRVDCLAYSPKLPLMPDNKEWFQETVMGGLGPGNGVLQPT